MSTNIKIFICVVVLILTGAYWHTLGVFSDPQPQKLQPTASAEILPILEIPAGTSSPETSKKTQPTATIIIGGIIYTIEIQNTLLDAMSFLSDKERITFTSVLYPGLGEFINEINGIKNTGDKFWLYYVNGTLGSTGAGNYVPKEGDIIEWKFE